MKHAMNHRHTRRFGVTAACLAATVLCLSEAVASSMPVSVGTAGADLALSHGVDAVFGNPAHLGIAAQSGTQLRLFGIGGGLSNNALGFSDYRAYNGASLTAEDKSDILANIPPGGLLIRGEAGASALAMRLGRWALTSSAVGSARGRLDHDALELLFFGNAHRSDWSFNQTDASALGAWQVALSHGRPLGTLRNRPLYLGFSIAYIKGLYLAEASEVQADLSTGSGGLAGHGAAEVLTSTGGSGLGIDIGAAWQPTDHSTVSLKLENLVHTISWNRNVEITRYNLEFDDLTVDNFDDSLWVADDSTFSLADLSRGLPALIRLGAGREFSRARLALEASVSLSERFASSTNPRLAAGAEYAVLSAILLRSGASVGGASGFAIGWGLGLRLGPVAWDAAVRVDRGLWVGSGRGLTGAMSLDLNF